MIQITSEERKHSKVGIPSLHTRFDTAFCLSQLHVLSNASLGEKHCRRMSLAVCRFRSFENYQNHKHIFANRTTLENMESFCWHTAITQLNHAKQKMLLENSFDVLATSPSSTHCHTSVLFFLHFTTMVLCLACNKNAAHCTGDHIA
jgi:hypothetical protein